MINLTIFTHMTAIWTNHPYVWIMIGPLENSLYLIKLPCRKNEKKILSKHVLHTFYR